MPLYNSKFTLSSLLSVFLFLFNLHILGIILIFALSFQGSICLADDWSLEAIKERELGKEKQDKHRMRIINRLSNISLQKPYYNALFEAAEVGDIELLKSLSVKYNDGLKIKSAKGETLLHRAVESGNLELVKYLVEEIKIPIDAEKNDDDKTTPLANCIYSIYRGNKDNIETARYLIQNKAKFNTSLFGKDIMFYVVLSSKLDFVKFCENNGAKLPKQITQDIIDRTDDIQVLQYLFDKKIKFTGDLNTALITAVKEKKYKKVSFLIKRGADVNYIDPKEELSAVMLAALKGDLATVKLLVKNKASLSPKGISNNVLYYAAESGNPELFDYLVKQGFSIQKNNTVSSPLLIAAAWGGNLDIIKQIIDAKIPVNQKNDFNQNALHILARKEGTAEIIKYLVKNGADIQSVDKNGGTVLKSAVEMGCFENVKMIFDCGYQLQDIDKSDDITSFGGLSVFTYAMMQEKSEELVFFLLEHGCKPNNFLKAYDRLLFSIKNGFFKLADHWIETDSITCRGEIGKKLLEDLIEKSPKCNDFEGTIKFLVEHEVNLNFIDDNGDTALSRLCIYGFHDEEAKILLNNGTLPNYLFRGRKNILMLAIEDGADVDFLETLICGGVDITHQDQEGKTALVYAYEENNLDYSGLLLYYGASKNELKRFQDDIFVKSSLNATDEQIIEMVNNGANVNATNSGATALHYLCMRKDISLKTVSYLVEQGANINVKTNSGVTPLLATCLSEREDLAQYLISHGADVNVTYRDGFTPLMIASGMGSKKTVEALLNAGANIKAQDDEGRNALTHARLGKNTEIADMLQNRMKTAIENPSSLTSKTGTGFAVSENYVVTALHVVKGASQVSLKFGSEEWISGTIEAQTESLDIAIIKVNKPLKNYLPLTTKDEVGAGDDVFTMGYPAVSLLGDEIKYSSGVINAMSGIAGDRTLMQVSVPIQPGNSGSPLLNEDGEVIGMLTSTAALSAFINAGTAPQNVNWAVKADYISLCIDKRHCTGKRQYKNNKEKMQDVRNSTCLIITNRTPQ